MNDDQIKWVEQMASLPAKEWNKKAMSLVKIKPRAVQEVARKRLEKMGFIDLGDGSIWKWIEKEWFEKAKVENVVFPVYVQVNGRTEIEWHPSYQEYEETLGNGEKRRSKDYTKFHNFENKYLAWKEQERSKKPLSEDDLKFVQDKFF